MQTSEVDAIEVLLIATSYKARRQYTVQYKTDFPLRLTQLLMYGCDSSVNVSNPLHTLCASDLDTAALRKRGCYFGLMQPACIRKWQALQAGQ